MAAPTREGRPLRVLVVDDSATVRLALGTILGKGPGIEVTTASDPLIAMARMQRERPDVIVTDLEMPRMDGLSFLRRVMASEHPVPVVVCSALTGPGTQDAILALEQGAVAIVSKPRLGVREFLEESSASLIETVRGAASARLPRSLSRPSHASSASGARTVPASRPGTDQVIAMGASTGGTEALRTVLTALPPDCPGTLVVQHMPEGFTRAFAQRLDDICRVEVKEAEHGDRVLEGRVLIAPGNRHLLLQRTGSHFRVEIQDGPPVSRHRPSVDVLFRSVAQAAGPRAVGVVLTGMGNDGAQGMSEMKEAGAATIAQDEATCVVFGMPREAIARGAVDEVVPLPAIADRLLARTGTRSASRRGA